MLKKFFESGFSDQLQICGEVCKIKNRIKQTETEEFKAVITEKSGELQVEVGQMIYTIDAHALIPESVGQEQIVVGNRLCTKEGEYMISTATKSICEPFIACDLVKIRSI